MYRNSQCIVLYGPYMQTVAPSGSFSLFPFTSLTILRTRPTKFAPLNVVVAINQTV